MQSLVGFGELDVVDYAAMRAKAFLKIGEAAKLIGVSASTLRRWEQLGLIHCERTVGRYRLFSRSALQALQRIHQLRAVDRINPAGIRYLGRYQGRPRRVSESDRSMEQVAAKLAEIRQERGLTAREVASKVGVSLRALLAMERGGGVQSLAIMERLAQVYQTNLLAFFDRSARSASLVRPAERAVLRADPGVQMELLAFGARQMEPHLFRVAPKSGSGGSYQHEGEEFIYVLDGKFEIWLDETERYALEAGDSLYFQSTRPHRWRALGDREAMLLWINTPPTF